MVDLPLNRVPCLLPRGGVGHQFVVYGDCCSGIPDAEHERTFRSVNAVVQSFAHQPEFVCFLGDEVQGLTTDGEQLRRQWRHWLHSEMAWLGSEGIPVWHTTGNHTTYSELSEAVFREMLRHLPRNGPLGQEGLSYFVREGDLLLVFVNTVWSGLGEGRTETTWLDRTLTEQSDARYRFVFGHHPAHASNGFSGSYQRHLDAQNCRSFWDILVQHGVLAYFCSHMLAFDVQVYEGVLQILTAGAGTLPLMPMDTEYLHCVQATIDRRGLRYQVLDTSGQVREWLTWPFYLPPSDEWVPMDECQLAPVQGRMPADPRQARCVAWKFDGVSTTAPRGGSQSLLCGWSPGPGMPPLWIGLQGPEQRLTVQLCPAVGRSPSSWIGPLVPAGGMPFSFQVAVHTGMGPGGMLWRWNDQAPWSSCVAASPWGAERLAWPQHWSVGQDGSNERPFLGTGLTVAWQARRMSLEFGSG